MGLKGGANGAKAQFKEKFGDAFRDFESLSKAREAVGVSRSQTLAVVDGNVMLMQVPVKVDTFDGYVGVVMGQIAAAVRAAKHVVVVFDEPDVLTSAKREVNHLITFTDAMPGPNANSGPALTRTITL